MAKCIQELKVCQSARERIQYAFDLTQDFARRWEPDLPFNGGAAVRPALDAATGLEYATPGGHSGAEEPVWPPEEGDDPVDDGTNLWTGQPISFASLRFRIDTVDWDTVAGITLSDQVETDAAGLQEARITVSGGTAGKKYTCPAIVTTQDGQEFEVRLVVTTEA